MMTYDEYREAHRKFAAAQEYVAAAARQWAAAIENHAALVYEDADMREPWAEVQTADRWAEVHMAIQLMRETDAALRLRVEEEVKAAEALRAAKLAYYEACAVGTRIDHLRKRQVKEAP